MASAKEGRLFGSSFHAKRYDADKFGFLQANIELGLQHPETADRLKSYLQDLTKEWK